MGKAKFNVSYRSLHGGKKWESQTVTLDKEKGREWKGRVFKGKEWNKGRVITFTLFGSVGRKRRVMYLPLFG